VQIILIGAPGSGKGTQAKLLAEKLGFPHISTGDILRHAVKDGTSLGREAEPIMARGELVPDDLMVGMIGERLEKGDVEKGFILDGFPRTVAQSEKLDTLLAGNGKGSVAVLNFLVPDEQIVRRISGRASCPSCGAVYHLENFPPKQPGICDRCGAGLVIRPDDTEEAVRKRLEAFRRQTLPVVDRYRAAGKVVDVDGMGSVGEVFERIEKLLD
jgi:adenylate kinase